MAIVEVRTCITGKQAEVFDTALDYRCRKQWDPFAGKVGGYVFSADKRYPGWVEVLWSRPTGGALEAAVTKLKALKLTIRNTPMNGEPVSGTCLFTGEPAVERITIARAY